MAAKVRRSSVALLFVLPAAALLLMSCSTLQVGSDYDRSAGFAGYHCFNIMQREHRGAHNPRLVTRAEVAIRRELSARGYAPQSEEPIRRAVAAVLDQFPPRNR